MTFKLSNLVLPLTELSILDLFGLLKLQLFWPVCPILLMTFYSLNLFTFLPTPASTVLTVRGCGSLCLLSRMLIVRTHNPVSSILSLISNELFQTFCTTKLWMTCMLRVYMVYAQGVAYNRIAPLKRNLIRIQVN